MLKQAAIKGAEAELAEAEREMDALADEGLTWRITEASRARDQATRSQVAAGGEEEDRDSLSKQLQKLLDDEVWVKKKG